MGRIIQRIRQRNAAREEARKAWVNYERASAVRALVDERHRRKLRAFLARLLGQIAGRPAQTP